MTHHHHHPHEHPRAAVGPSFLRASVAQRLLVAAGLSGAVWAAILWALA